MDFSWSDIGENNPVFVVAEISGNHGGQKPKCLDLIRLAKAAGANAVKFQTYTPDTITLHSEKSDFLLPNNSPWESYGSLHELYAEAHTPWEWHKELFEYARSLDLVPFSSPFDESAVELLEDLECPIYKIASPEINHIPLIKKVARTLKPIIFSLGVASRLDLDLALETVLNEGNRNIAILQCHTSYPAPLREANLKQIDYLRSIYGNQFVIGYSDHTQGIEAAKVAVSVGAKIVEKHIVEEDLSRTVDSFFSSGVEEFTAMVTAIRETESILGNPVFREIGENGPDFSRRSIYPAVNLNVGDIGTPENLKVVRPGLSLHPKHYETVIGAKLLRNIGAGERISLEDFEL